MSGPATPALRRVWADPLSLAATDGVAFAFLSSGYLDVSVPRVGSDGLCIQPTVSRVGCPSGSGCPIRESRDQRLVGSFPRLIAASYALHRLPAPRHPPCALSSLTTRILASLAHRLGVAPMRRRRQEPPPLRGTVVRLRAQSHCLRNGFLLAFLPLCTCQRTRHVPTRNAEVGTRNVPHSGFPVPSWWSRWDSNPRPPGCKPGALPTELRPRQTRNSKPGTQNVPHSHFSLPRSEWWAQVDSNHRPRPYQGRALAD